jgi:hypothetical protein
VILEGYADSQEPNGKALSDQRAQAVRKLIAEEVKDPDLYFEMIPRGHEAPIAPNDTPMGRLINRRVQIYIGEDERDTSESASASATPPEPECRTSTSSARPGSRRSG